MSVQIPPRPAAPTVASPSSAKAGPLGPGAGKLMTEYLLPAMLPTQPQQRMKKAWQIGESVAYVFAAERVISGKIAGMSPVDADDEHGIGWHLEDPDGETVDDAYPVVAAREAFQVLSKPMGALSLDEAGGIRQSRRTQWELTSRHAGLCGTAFWVLDGINAFGFPRAILYCRPDRISPDAPKGTLQGWRLDAGEPGKPEGIPLSRDEVVPFYLQAPNEGFVASGLVEAAITKAQLNSAIDRYFTQVIAGGGRLSGIIAPRDGRIDDDAVYQQLLRDWRNVTEQPEAAKRLQVVRAPVDFTRTVNTPAEMGLIDLMTRNRDDLLALWGVPYSQVGGSPAAGMGMGEARDSDRQALWENAVIPRLAMMAEPIQDLLDRLEPELGWAPRFVLDLPELEPDATKWDRAKKAEGVAMRNVERRALVGLPPFGEEVVGPSGKPLDEEVWLPINLTSIDAEPEPALPAAPSLQLLSGGAETEQEDQAETDHQEQEDAADEGVPTEAVGAAKAKLPSGMGKLRSTLDRRVTPALQKAVQKVLDDQRDTVATRVERAWSRIQAHPADEQAWWPSEKKSNAAMLGALKPALLGVGELVGDHVEKSMGGKKAGGSMGAASKRAVQSVLTRGAARVTRIDQTTREGLRKLLADAVKQGLSPKEAGDLVRAWSGFDEYRAERIARTELMFAYNAAALDSYAALGAERVEAIDGDDDEECAARNGQVYTLAEAEAIEDHPNGTLDWAPVL